MNPAPRTTEEEWEEWPKKWLVRADLARELETELTEARAQLIASRGEIHNLTNLWRDFIHLLEIVEETDDGVPFRPNSIRSCRALDGGQMQSIIERAKALCIDLKAPNVTYMEH
jgi:hypothetical protein